MSNTLIKEKLVFLIGFGIGFSFALFMFLMQYPLIESPICDNNFLILWGNQNQNARRNLEKHKLEHGSSGENIKFGNWLKEVSETKLEDHSYEKWLKCQNMQSSELDLDSYTYGSKTVLLESQYLMDKVRVTCVVFVEKLKLAKAAAETWGSRCNKLYFFGQHLEDSSLPVIKFKTKLTSSWQLLCESMNYIWKHSSFNKSDEGQDLEWTIFVKDDTIVLPENLRYIVAPLNHEEDHYLGHAVTLWGQAYNVAEAGYVLSKSAFRKVVKMFDNSDKCASGGKYWKKEDFYLGKHLASIGIYPSDTRDTYLRGTFHGYSLQTLFWGVAKPGQYWTKALYPPGPDCCSTRSATFSAVDSGKMYTLNYILYHLNVFPRPGVYGTKPAPTTIPDEEVWKVALKEEFGIENMTEISSDRYYEIWRSKYSEPETFIKKTYTQSPDFFNSLLTSQESQNRLKNIS